MEATHKTVAPALDKPYSELCNRPPRRELNVLCSRWGHPCISLRVITLIVQISATKSDDLLIVEISYVVSFSCFLNVFALGLMSYSCIKGLLFIVHKEHDGHLVATRHAIIKAAHRIVADEVGSLFIVHPVLTDEVLQHQVIVVKSTIVVG